MAFQSLTQKKGRINWSGLFAHIDVRLEGESGRELDDPRVIGAEHLAKCRTLEVGVRVLKFRVIEYVEDVHAKLKGRMLGNGSLFGDSHVQVDSVGATQNVSS